jgi:hypothetical protein
MELVSLLQIEDTIAIDRLLRWYTHRSKTFTYIQNEIVKEHRSRRARGESASIGMVAFRLCEIVCSRPSEVPPLGL